MQLEFGVSKRQPNTVQINRQSKQQHHVLASYQTISKYPLCTSCIMSPANNKNSIPSGFWCYLQVWCCYTICVQDPHKGYMACLHPFTFVKIEFEISCPRIITFPRIKNTCSLQLLLLQLWHIHSQLPQR
jgi:hypothetical protein